MKSITLVPLTVLAIALAACSPSKFSSESSQPSTNSSPSSTGPSGDFKQPADPAPGCNLTFEQSQCAWARAAAPFFTTIADGSSITGSAGNLLLKGRHISEVKDFTGNLIFLGTADDAKIDVASNVAGNVIICNADLGILEANSIGNVIVVGGNVDAVKDFTGNLIVSGTIGSVDNATGNVLTLP